MKIGRDKSRRIEEEEEEDRFLKIKIGSAIAMVGASSLSRASHGGSFFLMMSCNHQRPLLLLQQFVAFPSKSLAAASKRATFSAQAGRKFNKGRMWKKCFCTAPSSESSAAASASAGAAVVEEESSQVDGEMTNIREAANTLDIRVGKVLKAWRHEEADSLYVEEVDVGEPQPRIICSGLVKYLPLEHLQDINVVVLANLKPRNMRGVKSYGMLMAASDASHENVELLVPPEGSLPGQRIWFGSVDVGENLPDAASPNQIQKKKIWELVQPHLRIDDSCIASLGMYTMRTSGGVVVCRSLKNARIS